MEERAQKSFPGAIKTLAFLPLLLMGAGVWFYLSRHALPETSAVPAPAALESRPAVAAKPVYLPGAAMPSLNLEIKGPPVFVAHVTQALKLVWTADRDTFLFLKGALYVIRNGNKTDFFLEDGRPVATISTAHAFRSHTWCAGIIAHQAWHAWYTQKGRKKNRSAPPLPGEAAPARPLPNPLAFDYKNMTSILEMENRASAFQLDVLKKTGAPAAEKNLVFRRAPRDFETGHDGNYTLNP